MSKVFEETFDDEYVDDFHDETKGSKFLTISNGLGQRITVKVMPTKMVVKNELREKRIGIGAGVGVGGSISSNMNMDYQAILSLKEF